MAGNARFQLNSSNSEPGFAGNFPNEKRRNQYGPSMDRSGSFREGVESRMFGSSASISRSSGGSFSGGDVPSLSQCLSLEPIVMGDQKNTRSGELKRIMGFPGGCSSEDNSFGAAHSKPSPPVVMEDLKRFRSNVQDTCNKARGRVKKLDENLHKLTKYCDSITSKKQQQRNNELVTNDRSSGLNLKNGALIHRNPPDLVTQKLEDRPKNVLLNKRVRTSVAETRAESQSNGSQRHALLTAKDRDLLPKDSAAAESFDQIEEKIRRLPAGGEGWDKKRKRSVGPNLSRPVDGEPELKRPIYHKLSSEPAPTAGDINSFRSGSSNGINKLDGTCLATGSSIRGIPKLEHDRATTSKDSADVLNKDRHPTKGSNKFKNLEDNHMTVGPAPVTKGKASRASRAGSIGPTNSSPNVGTPEDLEQYTSSSVAINKIPQSNSGAHQRKRAMSSGSSSPPKTQWGGRRPQKISRTRRTNLVSPISSNHEELQIPPPSPSDFSARLASSSTGPSGPIPSRSGSAVANGHPQQFKIKLENVQSPARLSESDESGAAENRLKEKASLEVEEKSLNVVQNGGLSSTVLLTKKNKFVLKDEIGDGVQRQGRSGGRGSSFPKVGMAPAREKLDKGAATAKPFRSARPSSEKNGSKSGRPLKKMSDRKGFSRLGHMQNNVSRETNADSDDREELLAAANYAHNSSYLACSSSFWKRMEPTFASVSLEDKSYLSQQLKFAEELQENIPQTFAQENNILEELVDNCEEGGNLFGTLDFERSNKATSLFQRVLSAVIVDEEVEEEYKEEMNNVGRNMSVSNNANGFSYNTFIDAEPGMRDDIIEFECDSVHRVSPHDSQYEQMGVDEKLLLELHSIGLYPDSVPIPDGKAQIITQQIVELKKGLDEQVGKRKMCLEKLFKAIGSSTERRDLEQVAMDRLVELSYRKLLATRGSSRGGVAKVPKQVALGFARRTLARCHKFEESGISCFNEPALRDIIFAPPSWVNVTEPITSKNKHLESHSNLPKASSGVLSDSYEMFTHLSDEAFAKNGPITNRGKKKEVFLDDFATATPFRTTSSLLNSGAKGKRSERERENIPKVGPGRPPQQGNFKGERKTKTKPKHTSAQLSMASVNGNISSFPDTRAPPVNRNNNSDVPNDLSREATNFPLCELDPIEELGVGTGIDNDHEDLSSLFNFEDDGLQEHFSAGLEIPMDDLSGLNMF